MNEQRRIELADNESDSSPERSALIAVVRGLEALEQPSKVTLVTSSPYVNKGLRYGLKEWRENNYHWEHFGSEKPIRNADLWKRVDQAMQFHCVDCRLIESTNDASCSLESEVMASEVSSNQEIKKFRVDAAHNLQLDKSVLVQTTAAPRLHRNVLRFAVQQCKRAMHFLMSLVAGVITIPEKTIYAIESVFDQAAELSHRCSNAGTVFRRANRSSLST